MIHKIQYHSRFSRSHTYTRKYKMESTILDFRTSPWRFAFRGTVYFLSAKLAMESVMTFFDALFTFLFGVALPSWDVYSDLIFALTLAIPRCYDYEGYHYYEKYHNWSRKYIIFTGTFMLKQRCLKNVLIHWAMF